jgi:hypothetical protein
MSCHSSVAVPAQGNSSNSTNTSNEVRLELYAGKLLTAGAFKGTSDCFAIVTVLANNQ